MSWISRRGMHDYRRRGITSLFAVFNIADGTVISELHRRHRPIEFRKFPAKIDKAVPADLDVHVVCDNYATHNTAEIRTWLARYRASTSTSPARIAVTRSPLVRPADRQADPPRRPHLRARPAERRIPIQRGTQH